jgi:tRNA nucleotidyltransferase/poly(A) polymerase
MTTPQDPRTKPPCLQSDALAVLKRLRDSGHQAYFAGGAVRDTLLGLTPKDYDIATDALPTRIRELFPDTQAVGAAFGVILVRHNQSIIEVATFRADGPYEDGRRPASVHFATAELDAQRRDFTINGLFFDPLENKVIDYVGGQSDLKSRRLRAIGLPSKRFDEDHLRLLRAVRFAARFSLEIEPQTAQAIRDAAPQLKGISPERVGDELRLMFAPPTRQIAWPLLWHLGLAKILFRFLPAPPETIDLDRSIFLKLPATSPIPFSLAVAAAVLCVRIQSEKTDPTSLLTRPEVSRSIRAMRQALRLSNAESDDAAEILQNLSPLLAAAPPALAAKKRFLAHPTSPQSRTLMDALQQVGIQTQRIRSLADEFLKLQTEDNAPPPLITGDDLTRAGFNPGPSFKKILDTLYDAQLEGRLTDKEQAMQLARQLGQA